MVAPNKERRNQLEFDTNSPIANAFRDFAASRIIATDQRENSSHASSSAANLERIIRNDQRFGEQPQPSLGSSDVSELIPEELAAVFAYGVWASNWLPISKSRELVKRLEAIILDDVSKHVIQPHLKDEDDVDWRLNVFPSMSTARRVVLQSAVKARYGSLARAPEAYRITGVPFVLFVHEAKHSVDQEDTGDSAATDINICSIFRAWKTLTECCSLLKTVQLENAESARAVVASELKEAVKMKGLAPVLLVLKSELNGTLCAAAPVIRAICDRYGVHFHVEGAALAALLAGSVTRKVMYDAGDLLRTAHSAVLSISQWFGQYRTAAVLYSVSDMSWENSEKLSALPVDEDEDERSLLTSIMGQWFLLDRFQLPRVTAKVQSLFECAAILVDALSSIPFLVDVRLAGCGSNVYISYCHQDADDEVRWIVNRAMLWRVKKYHPNVSRALSMIFHNGYEWLLLSPVRIAGDTDDTYVFNKELVMEVCCTLVKAAKQYELVLKARATFIAEMRQCKDVEVESLALLNPNHYLRSLFFAALRVTPYGEVSHGGLWMKDADMSSKVRSCTLDLSEQLQGEKSPIEVQLESSYDSTSVPAVLVGPNLSHVAVTHKSAVSDVQQCDQENEKLFCTQLVEDWDFTQTSAQEAAVSMAEAVTDAIASVLTASAKRASQTLHGEDRVLFDQSHPTPSEDPEPSAETSNEHLNSDPEVIHEEKQYEEAKPEHGGPVQTTQISDRPHHVTNSQDSDKKGANPSEPTEMDSASMSPEVNDGRAEKPRKRFSVWRLIFGSNEGDDDDDDSSSDSTVKELEDDYFRP